MEYIIDELITNKSDELYDLQDKYKVKISRSQSSDAVYIFKRRDIFKLRIGHPIHRGQHHLNNFNVNVQVPKVTKTIVEEQIKKYLNRF